MIVSQVRRWFLRDLTGREKNFFFQKSHLSSEKKIIAPFSSNIGYGRAQGAIQDGRKGFFIVQDIRSFQ